MEKHRKTATTTSEKYQGVFEVKMKLVYKDAAGNKLFKKLIKGRKITQYSVKNRQGNDIPNIPSITTSL